MCYRRREEKERGGEGMRKRRCWSADSSGVVLIPATGELDIRPGNLRWSLNNVPVFIEHFSAPMACACGAAARGVEQRRAATNTAVAERTDGGPRRSDPARQIRNAARTTTLPLRRCDHSSNIPLEFSCEKRSVASGTNSSRQAIAGLDGVGFRHVFALLGLCRSSACRACDRCRNPY